jgi:hypothetical protein
MREAANGQWTCSYRGRTGARANATFRSLQQAKQFAEDHAGLRASPERWVETDRGWVLRVVTAQYLVQPT